MHFYFVIDTGAASHWKVIQYSVIIGVYNCFLQLTNDAHLYTLLKMAMNNCFLMCRCVYAVVIWRSTVGIDDSRIETIR